MSHGKKIGTLHVELDRIIEKVRWGGTGDRHATFEVDLRFDIHSGLFHVEHDGKWYSAKSKAELEEKIKKAVERTIDLVWDRYLVVSYNATAREIDPLLKTPGNGGNIYSIHHGRDEKRERHKRREITGIDLTWKIVEYTRPWKRPENGKVVRSKRTVQPHWDSNKCVEHIGDPEEQDDDSLPSGAVLWSKEREDLLLEILAMLGKLDARMQELFYGSADDLAKKLDAVMLDPSRLLAAPENPEPKKKRKRA